MTALRILHVRTVRGTGGGPDKTILNSCARLARTGHTAEAFYILDACADTAALPEAARNRGVCLHVALEKSPFSLGTFHTFGQVLAAGRFDIVHAHDYKANALAWFYCRRFGYRTVATAHGYNRTTVRELFYYALEGRLLRRVGAVITPSYDLSDRLRAIGVPADKLHVIPNGIETAGWNRPVRKAREGRIRLLYLGRFSEEKDPGNLLAAMALLRKRGLDVALVLAGAGPERKRLEQEAMALDLADCVTMPGHVADVLPLLAEAEALVVPSRTECMPNVILEAMWSGAPVVATAVGGVAEMLRDGVEGLLCPPRDAQALADAVERLVRDPALAARLAENAYRRVTTEFTFDKHIEATMDIYRRILEEKGS